MRFSVAASALVALAAPVVAQNATFLAQLTQDLQSMGLTSLANVTTVINSTTTGQTVLASLDSGPLTLFAPNNDAWAGALPNITSSADALAEVMSYHVVPGTFTANATYPNTTVGRTLLNSTTYLEGNKAQVLAWSEQDGTLKILNQNTPNVVVNSSTIGNVTLHVTSAVIDVPGDLGAALAANNLTQFAAALQNASLYSIANTQHGVTLFAPTDAAFAAVQQNLTGAQSNTTLLTTIIQNHVINGTTLYTGNLIALGSSTNETTGAGEGLSATFNTTGGYISSGNATAKIVTPDVILWNGVLHIIDSVLLNEESDPTVASSAISSASAAATSSASGSAGPVGFTPSPSGSAASESTASAVSSASLVSAEVQLTRVGIASATSVFGLAFGRAMGL